LIIQQGIAVSLVIVRVALGLARAGAIKPQSMQNQQISFSVKSMVERHNAMAQRPKDSRKSGGRPMFLDVGQSDFIACAVEVVHARDTDSVVDSHRSESGGEQTSQRADTSDF
jgi:hypothetical protein